MVSDGVNLPQMTMASDPALGSEMQNKMLKTGQVVLFYYLLLSTVTTLCSAGYIEKTEVLCSKIAL